MIFLLNCLYIFVLRVFDNFKYVLVGLTVLKADEVYDIMERDYPEKFKVCFPIFLVFFEALVFTARAMLALQALY